MEVPLSFPRPLARSTVRASTRRYFSTLLCQPHNTPQYSALDAWVEPIPHSSPPRPPLCGCGCVCTPFPTLRLRNNFLPFRPGGAALPPQLLFSAIPRRLYTSDFTLRSLPSAFFTTLTAFFPRGAAPFPETKTCSDRSEGRRLLGPVPVIGC